MSSSGGSSQCFLNVAQGLPNYTSPTQQGCLRGYSLQTKLGEGVHGTVWQVCDQSGCDWVVKIITDPDSVQARYAIAWEVFILRRLTQTAPRVVPILREAWLCNGVGYIILEKMDGTVQSMLVKQGYLQVVDIEMMVLICVQLGTVGVLHGDLKLDQFLVKNHPSSKAIYIADFGLSRMSDCPLQPWQDGAVFPAGWMETCSAPHLACIRVPADPSLWGYFNIWQLEKSMLHLRVRILVHTSAPTIPFEGFPNSIIPPAARAVFIKGVLLANVLPQFRFLFENDVRAITTRTDIK